MVAVGERQRRGPADPGELTAKLAATSFLYPCLSAAKLVRARERPSKTERFSCSHSFTASHPVNASQRAIAIEQ